MRRRRRGKISVVTCSVILCFVTAGPKEGDEEHVSSDLLFEVLKITTCDIDGAGIAAVGERESERSNQYEISCLAAEGQQRGR